LSSAAVSDFGLLDKVNSKSFQVSGSPIGWNGIRQEEEVETEEGSRE